MNIKAVAFDMDGTLFFSGDMISKSYQLTAKILQEEHQLPVSIPTLDYVVDQIGKPRREIYQILFPELDSSHYPLIEKINNENFTLNKASGDLFEGALEFLEKLKIDNLIILIASNGGLKYLNTITDEYQLPVDKPIITLNHETRFVKADILEEYLLNFDLKPFELIMVGDRIMDLEAALAHQVHFIGIEHAKQKSSSHINELKNASYMAYSFNEVYNYIQDIKKL